MRRPRLAAVLVAVLVLSCAVAAASLARASTADASSHPLRLVWSDEFNGPAGTPPTRRHWVLEVGPYGGRDGELETYTARRANVSLDGQGHLAITALPMARPLRSRNGTRYYTSARLDSTGRFSAQYGLIEARMEVPAGAGLWPAFWMVGNDIGALGWPRCGEVDIAEGFGNPQVIHGWLHGPAGSSAYGVGHYFYSPQPLDTGFHVYGIRWTRDSITWLLDGRAYATTRARGLARGARWVFNQRFHLLLNLAIGGPAGRPTAGSIPARLLVDWIRVYQ